MTATAEISGCQLLKLSPLRSFPPVSRDARLRSWVSQTFLEMHRNSWLSTAFTEMLATELAAGDHLRTVAEEHVARAKLELSLADEIAMLAIP